MPYKEAVQTEIKPSHRDHATLPVEHGFQWPQIVRDFEHDRGINLRTGSTILKIYSFRSILQPGVDPALIGNRASIMGFVTIASHFAAHKQAKLSRGLLKETL